MGMRLGEILESDWTLGAIKRREEERLRRERASSPGGVEGVATRGVRDLSGDNWVAEAFRRRQDEERARARQQSAGGERAHSASKETPVDNWLIEGFKRHQEDERRKDISSKPDEGGEVISASDDHVAAADYRASALSSVALVSRSDTIAPKKGSRRGWIVLVAALLIVGGLLSVIGLKTALWSPASAPKPVGRGDAPGSTPARKLKDSRTNTPSAPVRAGEGETKQKVPSEVSKQNAIAPNVQQQSETGSPTPEQGKLPQQNQAAPAAPAPAPTQPTAAEPASPPKSEKNLNAEPASVGPEKSTGRVPPGQEQSAPDSKSRPVQTNVGEKSKEKGVAGRHPPQKANGFSAFLKRTANSVRRFFGRLGQ
ncbi:hypothetical protein FEV16_06510 [Methylocystis sp. B8]|nr:hypothetical protein FEV16_06510 [Methylocystis sp. B8]